MTEAENKATILQFITEIYNEHNLGSLPNFLFPDVVDHNKVVIGENGLNDTSQGVPMLLQAFPDLQATVLQLLADADYVSCRMRLSGTNDGIFRDQTEPTGRSADWVQMIIFRLLEDGKIIEIWGIGDQLSLLQQLGLLQQAARPCP